MLDYKSATCRDNDRKAKLSVRSTRLLRLSRKPTVVLVNVVYINSRIGFHRHFACSNWWLPRNKVSLLCNCGVNLEERVGEIDVVSPMFWLVSRAGKMGLSFRSGWFVLIPRKEGKKLHIQSLPPWHNIWAEWFSLYYVSFVPKKPTTDQRSEDERYHSKLDVTFRLGFWKSSYISHLAILFRRNSWHSPIIFVNLSNHFTFNSSNEKPSTRHVHHSWLFFPAPENK